MSRLVAMLCALATVLVVSSAAANAPMCDEQAQSIAAPLPIFPNPHAELAPRVACGSQMLAALEKSAPHSSLQLEGAPGIERAVPIVIAWPPAPHGVRLAPLSRAPAPHRPGFGNPVYRPPRG